MQVDWVPVTRFEQNCSIHWCEETRRAAVVDPGGDLYRITDFLEWEDLTLEVVLVTHGHLDHAGGAAQLAAESGARIEGPHRGDENLVRNLDRQGRMFNLKVQSYTPHRWLEHGDRIAVGKQFLDVVHCPGHTRGHVSYIDRESRFACVGDTLFLNSIGAWEHADGNLADLVNSIRDRLFPLGDDIRFLPGHGETSTFGHERRRNPFVGDEALARFRSGQMPAASVRDVALGD